jgi:hypothetical protein
MLCYEALSTEELVSCDKVDGGCDGGDLPTAFKYYKKDGVATAKDYPDHSSKTGRTGRCTWNKETSDIKVTGFSYAIPTCERGDCESQDMDALAAALAKHGPISICINSGDGQGARAPIPRHAPRARLMA